jgi:hypothetical protein
MKFNILFFPIILFTCLEITISTKSKKNKNKKAHKNTTLPNGLPKPDVVRPNYIIPELFCETCRAIINEALKELRTKTRESDVYDYISNACKEERYTRYTYIPKDIKRTCGIFLDVYQDEVVKLLTKRNIDMNKEDIIKNFCDDYTQVCKDVEVDYEKSFYKVHPRSEYEIDGNPLSFNIHNDNDEGVVNIDNKKWKKKDKKKKGKGGWYTMVNDTENNDL